MTDIDECTQPNTCGQQQKCINIPGSYVCTANSKKVLIVFAIGMLQISKKYYQSHLTIWVSSKKLTIWVACHIKINSEMITSEGFQCTYVPSF